MLNEEEQPIDLEEVTVTVAPQPLRLHVFTTLARAVRTRVTHVGLFSPHSYSGSRLLT